MEKKLVGITEAAAMLGVSDRTLQRWDDNGSFPAEKTAGGHRRYDLAKIHAFLARKPFSADRKTIAYARVSRPDRQADLARRTQVLELYCAHQGWKFDVITDVGSGMDYHREGFTHLLNALVNGEVERLVIAHREQLLRFGAELVFAICDAKNVDVVIINEGEDTTEGDDLARDMLRIVEMLSAQLHGSRSDQNRKLLDDVRRTVGKSMPL